MVLSSWCVDKLVIYPELVAWILIEWPIDTEGRPASSKMYRIKADILHLHCWTGLGLLRLVDGATVSCWYSDKPAAQRLRSMKVTRMYLVKGIGSAHSGITAAPGLMQPATDRISSS
jgi:hypothetical protein